MIAVVRRSDIVNVVVWFFFVIVFMAVVRVGGV